jgi:hypothetical protein
MTDLIEFGIAAAIGAYLLLVFVAHVAWASRRAYFPNLDLCESAHDRFHLSKREKEELKKDGEGLKEPKEYQKAIEDAQTRFWHVIGIGLISHVPEELSITGFFATIVWPFIVLMNILLLAQVIGTLVGEGGGQWEVYPFGTYGAIPLLTAVLYAFSQSACGIIYGESKDKKRYLFLAFLIIAILAEGALAVYRAWLIRGGDATAGANVIDNSLGGRFGLVIGAFFGIFFPVTHAALGYVGYPKFVVPVVRYALRITGGISMLALAVANYFLLAWHSVHPKDFPDWIQEEDNRHWVRTRTVVIPTEEVQHRDQQRKLLAEAAKLSGYLRILLDDLPATPATVTQTVAKARELLRRWNQVGLDANQKLAEASKLVDDRLKKKLEKEGEIGVARIRKLYELAESSDILVNTIKSFRETELKLEQDAKDSGKLLLAAMASCRADLVKLKARLEEIGAEADQGITPEGLRGVVDVKLAGLEDQFRAIPAPLAGHFRYPDHQELAILVKRCQAAHRQLVSRWARSEPVIPTAQELEALRVELEAVPDLTQAYADARKSLYESLQIASERLKRVEGRPRWFYWLADRIA